MTIKSNGADGFARRRFLQGTAALGAGTALSRLLGARAARADTPALDMWWWGEQELPGLQAFVDDSVKNYSAATVKTMLQDTNVVISQFQTAAAAGKYLPGFQLTTSIIRTRHRKNCRPGSD